MLVQNHRVAKIPNFSLIVIECRWWYAMHLGSTAGWCQARNASAANWHRRSQAFLLGRHCRDFFWLRTYSVINTTVLWSDLWLERKMDKASETDWVTLLWSDDGFKSLGWMTVCDQWVMASVRWIVSAITCYTFTDSSRWSWTTYQCQLTILPTANHSYILVQCAYTIIRYFRYYALFLEMLCSKLNIR